MVHCSSIFPFMFGVLLYYWDTNILWRIYILGCPNDFDTSLNKWQSFLPTEPAIGCRARKPPPLLKHGWGIRRLLSPKPISTWFSNETCSENLNEVVLLHITCVVLEGVSRSSQACVRSAKKDKVEGLWNQLEELLTGPLGPNHVCSSCCSLTSQEDPTLPKIHG